MADSTTEPGGVGEAIDPSREKSPCRAESLERLVFAHAHALRASTDRAEAVAELIGLARGNGAVLAAARDAWDAIWRAWPDDESAAFAADLLHEAVGATRVRLDLAWEHRRAQRMVRARLGHMLGELASEAESRRAADMLVG